MNCHWTLLSAKIKPLAFPMLGEQQSNEGKGMEISTRNWQARPDGKTDKLNAPERYSMSENLIRRESGGDFH